jgi:hypothetical protein
VEAVEATRAAVAVDMRVVEAIARQSCGFLLEWVDVKRSEDRGERKGALTGAPFFIAQSVDFVHEKHGAS